MSSTSAMVTAMLEKNCCKDYTEQGEILRDWFSKTSFERIRPTRNHTHGLAAATRSAGVAFIDRVMAYVSETPVMYQGSQSDVRRGRPVERDWYWTKDLSMAQCHAAIQPAQPVAMVDVDEYVDMPERLALDFRPYILYTFQPSMAAKSQGDYTFTFLPNGDVKYIVSGGGQYVHPVWNYGHDNLKAVSHQWLWLSYGLVVPIRIKVISFYKIERRNVDENHQVILLTPLRQWTQVLPGGMADLADRYIQGDLLTRLNPVEGDFIRLRLQSDGMQISSARVGDFQSVTVPVGVDEEVATKSELSKDKLTVAMAKASMYVEDGDKTVGAEILTLYHRQQISGSPPLVFKTTHGVRSFQFTPKLADYDPEVAPTMRSFMNPLVDGGFCPDKCKNNDVRSIRARVTDVECKTVLSRRAEDYISEFVSLLVKDVGSLQPVDEEEVWKRQNRPSQQRILQNADLERAVRDASTFGKAQPEGNVSDPRNITQINGCDKRDYSRFMYALSDALKQFKWYASGNCPRETASRVADIAERAEWLAETDFSRMDGRIGEVPRHLEHMLALAVFPKMYHAELLRLMRSQTWLRCRSRFGVKYNSRLSRASGSPETSTFNTVLSVFTSYVIYRIQGSTTTEAFELLGIFLGDDGLSANVTTDAAQQAASLVGQKLTLKMVPHGQVVSFLSRFYGPEVWFGSPDSCCDIRRQLTKFHLAVTVSEDHANRRLKLREKAFAFWLTDECTPVLGPFVSKVLEYGPIHHGKSGVGLEYTNVLGIWNSKIGKEDQYLSLPDDAGWKRELLEKQLPDFSIETFLFWLRRCNNLDSLMDPPTTTPIPALHPGNGDHVVVDGDVLNLAPIDTASEALSRTSTRRGKRGGKRHSPTSKGSKDKREKQLQSSESSEPTKPNPRKPKTGPFPRPATKETRSRTPKCMNKSHVN